MLVFQELALYQEELSTHIIPLCCPGRRDDDVQSMPDIHSELVNFWLVLERCRPKSSCSSLLVTQVERI